MTEARLCAFTKWPRLVRLILWYGNLVSTFKTRNGCVRWVECWPRPPGPQRTFVALTCVGPCRPGQGTRPSRRTHSTYTPHVCLTFNSDVTVFRQNLRPADGCAAGREPVCPERAPDRQPLLNLSGHGPDGTSAETLPGDAAEPRPCLSRSCWERARWPVHGERAGGRF